MFFLLHFLKSVFYIKIFKMLYLLLIILLSLFNCGSLIQFSKDVPFKRLDLEKLRFYPNNDESYPFQNKSLPVKVRVNDLVSRLTLDEIVLQLSRGGAGPNGPAPAIDRLGIRPYNWNNEGIHGYVSERYSTGYPSPVGLAATFNKTAISKMASAVAVEARASYNEFSKEGNYGDHTCLSLFAPVINIMRHPLWGRNQETYGEDPVLTSYLARSYISGLQQTRQGYPGATSVCKHFGVHDGPENIPTSRFSFNSVVNEANFGQTYMVAFRQCVLAHTYGVMCSYNAINGVPACANKHMITDVLRGKFAFDGYVVSDEGAVEHIDSFFNYTKTPLDTAVASMEAGLDLELTYYGVNNRYSLLKEAVQKGRVDELLLMKAAKRLFFVRMILGEFDPPQDNPWNEVGTDEILSESHRSLAAEIAEQSYVLLKNDGLLPMKMIEGRIAFLGPFANNTLAVTGDYNTDPNGTYTTPADSWRGLSSLPPNIASGCVGKWDKNLPLCREYNSSMVEESVTSDVGLVVVTVGTGTNIEAEGRDRANTSLPSNQYKLIEDAVKYSEPTNIPVVVVIYSASPVRIDDVYEMKGVSSILLCHFPAQEAGTLGALMSGEKVPAARLPYTWYKGEFQLPSITEYNVMEMGLTYRYTDPSNVLFPFGFGLSYSQFFYGNLQISNNHPGKCEEVKVQVEVTNTGDYDADEVIQSYIRLVDEKQNERIKLQLVSFERVHIPKKSSATISFVVELFSTAIWQSADDQVEDYDYYVISGSYNLWVGGQQPGQSETLSSNIVQGSFTRADSYLLSACDMKN